MSALEKNKMYRIGVLLIDGFSLMSYASLIEPFRAANLLSNKNLYTVTNITKDESGASSSSKLKIMGERYIDAIPVVDLLLVVAGGDPMSFSDSKIFNWLNRISRHGITIGGVSGGPVVLVKSGLMSEYRMTVHWEHAEVLEEIAHDIVLEKSLYVIDRDRMTCAGGTAPMDMVLALISSRQGAVFAQLISDWFLHTKIRPSGSSQRGKLNERVGTNNDIILSAVTLMENHLGDPLDMEQLSRLSSISSRQLNRVFKKHIKQSTMKYYRELRLNKAKNLLRNSSMKVSEIAEMTGFANPSHLTMTFSNIYRSSPTKYRASNYD